MKNESISNEHDDLNEVPAENTNEIGEEAFDETIIDDTVENTDEISDNNDEDVDVNDIVDEDNTVEEKIVKDKKPKNERKVIESEKKPLGKAILAIIIVAVIAIGATGFALFNIFHRNDYIFKVKGTKATVDNVTYEIKPTKFSENIYKFYFNNSERQYDNGDPTYWKTASPDTLKSVKEYAEKMTKISEVSNILSKHYNIALDDNDKKTVQDNVDAQIKEAGGQDKFNETLKENYIDMETFKQIMTSVVLQNKVYEKLYGEKGSNIVSDDEISKQFIDGNKDSALVKHILIATQKDDGTKFTDDEKKQAYETAKTVLAKAKAGEDFDALITTYNKDQGMTMNPDGYLIHKGDMVEEFEKASYALTVGNISDIVETQYGYHIIKRYSIEDYTKKHLEDVKKSYYEDQYNKIVKEILASIDKNTKYSNYYDKITADYYNK